MQLTIECPNVLTKSITTPYRYFKAEKDGVTILAGMDGKRSYIQGYDPCRFVIPLFGDLSDCLAVIRAIQKKEINITELQSPELNDVLDWFKTGRVSELSVYTTKRWGMHCRLLSANIKWDIVYRTETSQKLIKEWINSYIRFDPFIKEAFMIQDSVNEFKALVPERLGALEFVFGDAFNSFGSIQEFNICRKNSDAYLTLEVNSILAAGLRRASDSIFIHPRYHSDDVSKPRNNICNSLASSHAVDSEESNPKERKKTLLDEELFKNGNGVNCLASALLWLYTH